MGVLVKSARNIEGKSGDARAVRPLPYRSVIPTETSLRIKASTASALVDLKRSAMAF